MYPQEHQSNRVEPRDRRVFVVGSGRPAAPGAAVSRRPRLRELATSFFKKSSIYALNQIGNSKTTRRKIFWSFILIGGLVGCCSQVYRYLSAYYDYPVVINIDSVNLFNQQFPGVTICNLNSIRKEYFKCVLEKQEKSSCKNDSEDTPGPDDLTQAAGWPAGNCLQRTGEELSPDYVSRLMLLSLTTGLKEESRAAYGHQGKDMIRSCTFNGEECSYTDFQLHRDDTYGNCFTFNGGKAPLTTSFVGPNSGLTLEMDVQAEDYVWLSQSVGARVVIHDPHHPPEPQAQGVNVAPGFETTIGLSKVVMKRLPYPYKDHCRDYDRGSGKRMCDEQCRSRQVAKECGCALLPSPDGARRCDLSRVEDLCCVRNGGGGGNDSSCDCPLECESADFELKLSSGGWPARPENLGENQPKDMSVEMVRETWVKVKVFFDTLEQLTYEQKAMFEDSEVLSQIGGQMGLWLGLSLAAMFECLENIVLLWHYRSAKKA